jgi:putative DNA methylase
VGAETQRERGASSALPPLYFLHVWWARRPLTPSRAAILASLLPADADPDWFLRQLGLERPVALIGNVPWRLAGKILDKRIHHDDGTATITVDAKVQGWFNDEIGRRQACRSTIAALRAHSQELACHPLLDRWEEESAAFAIDKLAIGETLQVDMMTADPAHVNERIEFAKTDIVTECLGSGIRWDPEDLYCYSRGYTKNPEPNAQPLVVLDPTSGGGSIPFEALCLGHKVIANELNPVATTILYATLDYPARYGIDLAKDIEEWGQKLVAHVDEQMRPFTPFSPLDDSERANLKRHIATCPEILPQFDVPEYDQQGLLYVRTVTCSHCGGEAPLFNTF